MSKTVCLAFTGASGLPYGVRLLECLLAAGCRVQLLYSQAAQIVAKQEMDLELPSRPQEVAAYFRQRHADLPGRLDRPRRWSRPDPRQPTHRRESSTLRPREKRE